jgi:outer membrane receptor protein involved in Fe transport
MTFRLPKPILLLTSLITFLTMAATAQDTTGVGGLQGRVTNPDGNASAEVKVCVVNLNRCVTTSADGRYRLADLRAGDYQLELTPPGGAATLSDVVQVRAGLDATVDITLDALDTVRQSITVSESVFVAPEEVKNSSFLVTQKEVFQAAGALQDVSRYVQTLPGVAIGSNDFRNDIIVRGGSPLENLFIVDNIEIPNINAFANFASAGGTVSILDANLLQDVNFLTGGYPAPYINRVSSVLQITQREGDRKGVRGQITSGFAGGGVVLEGPVNKGKGSWVVSARRSFLDLFTNDLGFGGVPVVYTTNSKFVYDLSARDRIWVANLTGVDNIRLGPAEGTAFGENADQDGPNEFDIRYNGWRSATGFNWQRLFGSKGVGLLGLTHSEASVNSRVRDLVRFSVPDPTRPVDDLIPDSPLVFGENSREGETTLKYDFTGYLPMLDKVQVGGSYKLFRIRYDAQQPLGELSPFSRTPGVNPFMLDERDTATQSGAYFQTSRNLGSRLNLTLGGRVDNYQILGATRFSPRAGLSYRVTDKLSIRGSYGQYFQQPLNFFVTVFPINRGAVPFRADHFVTGISYEISPTLRFTVEGYAKQYKDYPTALEYPTLSLANVGDTFDVSSLLFPITSAGRGRVRGIEFFLEKKFRDRWFGQANLAFSRTRHAALDAVFRPGSFDYPVIANFVGGYRINSKWEVSTRASFLSGRPFTPFDVEESTRQRRPIFDLDRVNAERADDYFRLDIRLDRTFTVRDKPLIVFLGVQNITNRRNFAQLQWDRVANQQTIGEQLGLFPLIGLDWRF